MILRSPVADLLLDLMVDVELVLVLGEDLFARLDAAFRSWSRAPPASS